MKNNVAGIGFLTPVLFISLLHKLGPESETCMIIRNAIKWQDTGASLNARYMAVHTSGGGCLIENVRALINIVVSGF